MNREQVKEDVAEIFKDVFDDDELVVSEETSAADIEDWDSLMHVTLVAAMEKHFNIRIKLKEVMGLQNVGEMLDIIMVKVNE